jgi:phosphocarrier protein
MNEVTVTIVNPAGMHARPASEFVRVAGAFACDIRVEKDGLDVNGKSIMGVLMLAAEQGSDLVIRAAGDDAPEALEALAQLVRDGFGDAA